MEYATTEDNRANAKSAEDQVSAITGDRGIIVRNVAVAVSAFTVDKRADAKNAEDLVCAIMEERSEIAESVVGQTFVSTTGSSTRVRNVNSSKGL